MWGDDLRVEGVVVEHLGGIDDLPAVVREFAPGAGAPARRARRPPGARQQGVAAGRAGACRRTCGSSATRTSTSGRRSGRPRSGIAAWPEVPRGTPWKEGVCAGLGWPVDPPAAWRRILGAVTSYADLEPSLLGRVEELIDFVTAPSPTP